MTDGVSCSLETRVMLQHKSYGILIGLFLDANLKKNILNHVAVYMENFDHLFLVWICIN